MSREEWTLAKERNKALSEQIACLIHGGRENVTRKREIVSVLEKEPLLSKTDKSFLPRPELYKRGLQIVARLIELKELHRWSEGDMVIVNEMVDMRLPVGLHHSMFIPTILGQATEEQKRKWLPLAKSYAIIGTYAQTELGHGSFIRGLETTAEFDLKTDEFVLNSPTLSSMKWWPGNLGKTCNFAIVLAQLVIKGKNYGLHAFMVQLRSLVDHSTLAGIELGDIGPKYGYDMVDNGFLRLHEVRIPRTNMLMRFAQVDRDGNFSKPPHDKIGYGTMVYVRSTIIGGAGKYLAYVITIAIRYSIVRRQFPPNSNPKGAEVQIIDYLTQQHKLFPYLAATYVMHFAGLQVMRMYHDNLKRISQGDMSQMAELHAVTAGLKSLTTEISIEGIEIARKSLGGHGFSKFSGVIDVLVDWIPSQTYEGENTVLYLQVASHIVKLMFGRKSQSLAPSSGFSYLFSQNDSKISPESTSKDFNQLGFLLSCFQHRSRFVIESVCAEFSSIMKSGKTFEETYNDLAVDLVRMAKCHSLYVLLAEFMKAIEQISDQQIRGMMADLFSMFACFMMERDAGDFLEDGFLSSAQIQLCRRTGRRLLRKIRPQALVLVDAWDFPDYLLNSALGAHDGHVYENLYKWAKKSPLNESDVADGVKQYLLPLMKKGQEKCGIQGIRARL